MQSLTQSVSFPLEFVAGLKIEPELTCGSEKSRQAQRGVGRYGAFSMYNLVYSTRWNRYIFRKTILTDSQRIQKFLKQNFSRMNRWHCGGRHNALLMVIDDLDVSCAIRLPIEANAPLLINADTVLAPAISGKSLQHVAWRRTQVLYCSGCIQQNELLQGGAR